MIKKSIDLTSLINFKLSTRYRSQFDLTSLINFKVCENIGEQFRSYFEDLFSLIEFYIVDILAISPKDFLILLQLYIVGQVNDA